MPSIARNEFLARAKALQAAILDESLSEKGPKSVAHNRVARVLRNGVTVIGFASLEDFLKARAQEIFSILSNSSVSFANLPTKFQDLSTWRLIDSMQLQLKRLKGQDKIDFAQSHAVHLASTRGSPFTISPITFGFSRPNLGKDEIKDLLSAFNVGDGWRQLSKISSRANVTALPLDTAFENAASRRHSAAHDASSNIPLTDLQQFVTDALGIAFAYDALLSSVVCAWLKSSKGSIASMSFDETCVKMRALSCKGVKAVEKKEGAVKATKVHDSLDTGIPLASNRAILAGEVLMVILEDGKIDSWLTPLD